MNLFRVHLNAGDERSSYENDKNLECIVKADSAQQALGKVTTKILNGTNPLKFEVRTMRVTPITHDLVLIDCDVLA